MARTPHDSLVQFTFQQLPHAEGLFRAILPPALATAIDWSTLRLQSGTHVDDSLRRQQSDLLFSARLSSGEVWLYLLTEHKAKNERWAVLQLLSYVLAIWRSVLQSEPRPGHLPLVVPILLHHGRKPWTAPSDLTRLLAGRGLPAPLRELLQSLQPAFRPLVVSIAAWPAARIRALSMTVFGKLVLEALQTIPGRSEAEIVAAVASWRDALLSMVSAPSAPDELLALWTYVLESASGPVPGLIQAIEEMEAEVAMKRKSAAAILRAAGHAEGKAEGKAEGLRESHARLLTKLMTRRFGALPTSCKARLAAASLDQLETWAVRTLTAPSLPAVFEG